MDRPVTACEVAAIQSWSLSFDCSSTAVFSRMRHLAPYCAGGRAKLRRPSASSAKMTGQRASDLITLEAVIGDILTGDRRPPRIAGFFLRRPP